MPYRTLTRNFFKLNYGVQYLVMPLFAFSPPSDNGNSIFLRWFKPSQSHAILMVLTIKMPRTSWVRDGTHVLRQAKKLSKKPWTLNRGPREKKRVGTGSSHCRILKKRFVHSCSHIYRKTLLLSSLKTGYSIFPLTLWAIPYYFNNILFLFFQLPMPISVKEC